MDSVNYNIERGSIKLSLKASYLKTLKSGNHTIRINTTAGFGEYTFNVVNQNSGIVPPANGNRSVPQNGNTIAVSRADNQRPVKTGDGVDFIIYTIVLISACAAISTALKKKSN